MSAPQPVPLLLMADYFADPVWLRGPGGGGVSMVSLDHLPLSTELKARLRSWAARFDALIDSDCEWPSEDERTRWVADGQALLAPLSEELGPHYDVRYHFAEGEASED